MFNENKNMTNKKKAKNIFIEFITHVFIMFIALLTSLFSKITGKKEL